MAERELTHLDPLGRARMVDVTLKEPDPPTGGGPREGLHGAGDDELDRSGCSGQG